MAPYICKKCVRTFRQKSRYDDHIASNTDCAQNTIVAPVIEAEIEEKITEPIGVTPPKGEITKETLSSFFEDLHNLLWNKAGLNPERALEHMTFFFVYRLIEQQADVLNLPQECRWSYIASLKNENDLFETIKKGVSSFRLKPKTKPFFKPHEIQKADIVYEIVQQINRISLTTLRETDTLGDIFEYMLGRGMSTMSDEGQYFTNRTICKLAFKLAYGIKKNLRRSDGSLCTFADWFCGTGGFPAEYIKGVNANLKEVDWKRDSGAVYCQDMNLSSVTTTLLNMLILTGIPFSGEKIRGSNSFSDAITMGASAPFPSLTVDYCFMNPPYGGDKTKGKEYKFAYAKKVKGDDGTITKKYFVNQEIQSIGIEDDDKVSAGVQLAMATLSSDGGICSIVLPQGFFFGASKKCVELRKKIAEDYKIHYVVDIESGAFANTGTKTSMLVFQKGVGATENVEFIGLDEKPLAEATLEKLRAKNYSLNFKQYLPQTAVEVEGFTIKNLSDIASDITFGFMVKSEDYGSDGVPVIKTKNIKATRVEYPANDQKIRTTLDNKYQVKRGDLLIVLGGSPGEHGIWNYTESAWLNQDCAKITIENEITKKFVFYMLGSDLVKSYIESNTTKTTIGHISRGTVRNIPIALPSLERQQQIVEAIDGWMSLAQQEEVALGILEKQVMFQVREMGRGKERVKLGRVIKKAKSGKTNSTSASGTGEYPFYGCTAIVPTNTHNSYDFEGEEYLLFAKSGGNAKTKVGENLGIGKFHYVKGKTAGNIAVFQYIIDTDLATYQFVYYLLRTKLEEIQLLADYTTGNGNINIELMYDSIELQLPSLAEQQTLQPDFDEIRHKHAKIATYKVKAQEAIQRLIPSSSPTAE